MNLDLRFNFATTLPQLRLRLLQLRSNTVTHLPPNVAIHGDDNKLDDEETCSHLTHIFLSAINGSYHGNADECTCTGEWGNGRVVKGG